MYFSDESALDHARELVTQSSEESSTSMRRHLADQIAEMRTRFDSAAIALEHAKALVSITIIAGDAATSAPTNRTLPSALPQPVRSKASADSTTPTTSR